MIKFIQQEASEKAQEIKLKADEEYNIEKLYMVEEEKQKIRQEYERKEKQVEVQKRMCAPPARPCGVVAAPARATGEGGCLRRPSPSVGLRLRPIRRGSVDGTLSVRLAAPVRSAQSNEIRYSRLKTLKARDDAMQEVKKQALAKLPSLTSGAGYADLLESLILEVRLRLRGRLRDASRRDPSCRTQPLITLAETNSPAPSPSPSPSPSP